MKSPLFGFVLISLLGMFLFVGCASSSKRRPLPKEFTSVSCSELYPSAQETAVDVQLDHVSELFNRACFQEVIVLGNFIRQQGHDKFYQASAELAEVFTPEGTFTDYTMESYERAYLSLLISMSYFNLHKESEVQVELRRSLEEDSSVIYNYGSDPVVTLLLAAIWDRYDPATARPYWKKVSEVPGQSLQVLKIAKARLEEIDKSVANTVSWRIYGIGQLPELDWQSDFIMRKNGPYKIISKQEFPPYCSTDESLLISTSSWVDKIGIKYQSSYHPFLYAKSLVRLPVGIGYGILGVTSGVGVGLGGCALGAYAGGKQGGGEFCGASLQVAGYLVEKSANLVEYTLSPDMRHWKKIPMAFYMTKEDPRTENLLCLKQNQLVTKKTVYLLE